MREVKLNECPVSFLSRAPEALYLVKLWTQAERNKTTLTELLGDDSAQVEDTENLLATLQDEVKAALEKDREKRIV